MAKLCVDCRWIGPGAGDSALCDHPKARIREGSPVTGRVIERRWPCNIVRMYGPLFPCGPDGMLWEPKGDGFIDYTNTVPP